MPCIQGCRCICTLPHSVTQKVSEAMPHTTSIARARARAGGGGGGSFFLLLFFSFFFDDAKE
jgi:hypothetical protein